MPASPHGWALWESLAPALIALRPLVAGIAGVLPDSGDSFHDRWTGGGTINRLLQGRGLCDANILYPLTNADAFQQLQPLNTSSSHRLA